jgi:hypothetical protein
VVDAADAERQLRLIFGQLPPELDWMAGRVDSVVGEAHLTKAAQHVMWGRPEQAQPHLARAAALGVDAGRRYLERLGCQLMSYETEFGARSASAAIRELAAALRTAGGRQVGRRLGGTYHLGRAFRHYGGGEHSRVPGRVLRAFAEDPSLLANRGAWSILLRSVLAGRSGEPALAAARLQMPERQET